VLGAYMKAFTAYLANRDALRRSCSGEERQNNDSAKRLAVVSAASSRLGTQTPDRFMLRHSSPRIWSKMVRTCARFRPFWNSDIATTQVYTHLALEPVKKCLPETTSES